MQAERGNGMQELVYLKNDEAVCDSLQVAEKFRKRHDRVLRAIDNLLKSLPKNGERPMFVISSRKADDGQVYRMYLMNRDGFSLLVMGFTGKKALEWKLQYINAFNKMEALIREKSTLEWQETRIQGKLTRKSETDTIKQLVEYARNQGSAHAEMLYMAYSKLADRMAGVDSRENATVTQLNNLALMEHIILNCIQNGMLSEKGYKRIYQDCRTRLAEFRDIAFLTAGAP